MVDWRRSSPSFIAAVVVVLLALAGYGGWWLLRPSGVAGSEQVVREFAAAAAQEIGPVRRQVRKLLAAPAGSPEEQAAARAQVDDWLADARDRVDALADDAGAEIEGMSGISLRTQQNRLDRIERRRAEAKAALDAIAGEAQRSLAQP